MKALPVAAACTAATLLLGGCGTADAGAGDSEAALQVTAAFYPLQWVSQRVGGPDVEVLPLTPPGAEPHDLELTPRDVGELALSDVVVHLGGFQPAVDDAVRTQAPDAGLDVRPVADLDLPGGEESEDHAGESADEHAEHADEVGGADPHFWLDPTRLQDVAEAVADRFAAQDPSHAAGYEQRARALVADLVALDEEFERGLADCRTTEMVTAHTAFGYLAQRYGLRQEGITGISPDVEPDAATLRDLAAHVRENGVGTVYAETLVSPAVAQTLARESGATVAVLDPVEGLTEDSAGADYLEVMRSNLATLRQGQQCR